MLLICAVHFSIRQVEAHQEGTSGNKKQQYCSVDRRGYQAHRVHGLQQKQKFHFMNAQKYLYIQGVDVPSE